MTTPRIPDGNLTLRCNNLKAHASPRKASAYRRGNGSRAPIPGGRSWGDRLVAQTEQRLVDTALRSTRRHLGSGQNLRSLLVILGGGDFVGLIASQQISQLLLLVGRNRQSRSFDAWLLISRFCRRLS